MKGKGTFKCEGCSQIFCSKHSIDHRHELIQKLEEIELTRDLVYQTFLEQSQQHLLLDQINQWEQKSIDKIHQTAEEARNRILQETVNLEQKLKDITNQLRQAHEDDDFVEIDLDQWTQKLHELEKNWIDAKTILIEEKLPPLVRKIRIEHEDASDIFQYVCGDIQIKENGYLIVKDNWIGFSEVLGKKEYTTGKHRIRFKIEKLRENGWMLFGVISKLESININSYIASSSYGWSTKDQVFIAGQYHKGQSNDIIQNDIITLIIDCDQKKLQMKNEQTDRIMELSVNINKCPFPWKLHFNFLTASTCIRILPT
jgi:hypothetical protein